jgi:hypothetical protein
MKVFEVSEGKTHFFQTQNEFDSFFTLKNDNTLLVNKEGKQISSFSSIDEICFYFNFKKLPNLVEHIITPDEKSNFLFLNFPKEFNETNEEEILEQVENLRKKTKYLKLIQALIFKKFENCQQIKEIQENQTKAFLLLNFYLKSCKEFEFFIFLNLEIMKNQSPS